ncbi:MAG: DUF6538 domain-containing protein [Paracoccaceae bacterium]
MAGAQRYLLNRDGRFFARLVVPKDLRSVVGKSELRAPLGPDRRTAIKLLPGAVAHLQQQIAQAERKVSPVNIPAAPARYLLAPEQIALSHYRQRLTFDDELRPHGVRGPRYASLTCCPRNRQKVMPRATRAADPDLSRQILKSPPPKACWIKLRP